VYEEVLARATADAWSEDVRGLWSKGGVYVVTPNRPPTDITNFAIRERTSKISPSPTPTRTFRE
jgi:hypothetical protein